MNLPTLRDGDLKIVFTGSVGAGKTTAIGHLSDAPVRSVEVPIADDPRGATLAFDQGQATLSDGGTLHLYGTPHHRARSQFVWDALGKGAFGLFVLVDNARPTPVDDVLEHLEAFKRLVPARRTVVGVGRVDVPGTPTIDDYAKALHARGFDVPVIAANVQQRHDVRLLLTVLVSMAEMG